MRKKILKRIKDKIKRKFGSSGRAYKIVLKSMQKFVNERKLEERTNIWEGIEYKIEKSIMSFSEEPDYNVMLIEPSWPKYDNPGVTNNIRYFIIDHFIESLGFERYKDRWAFHTERGKERVYFTFLKSISDCNSIARKFIEGYLRNKETIEKALRIFDYEYPESHNEGKELAKRLALRYE